MKKIIQLAGISALLLAASCNGSETTDDNEPPIDTTQPAKVFQLRGDTTGAISDSAMMIATEKLLKREEINCKIASNCGDQRCEENSVLIHQITNVPKFWVYVNKFHIDHGENSVPDPLRKSWDQLNAMVGSLSCHNHRLIFDVMTGPFNTHQNIGFTIANEWERPESEKNSYSITFMKGLLHMNPIPDSFHFYRATNGYGTNTLAIHAFKTDGSIVYYGDLSDAYPTPPKKNNPRKK